LNGREHLSYVFIDAAQAAPLGLWPLAERIRHLDGPPPFIKLYEVGKKRLKFTEREEWVFALGKPLR